MKSDLRELPKSYHSDLPYPKIEVDGPNIEYAHLIQVNYAGLISEFSAVTQYIYQKIALFNDYPEIASTLLGISEVEMLHLNMIGEIITLLGGTPGYFISKKNKNLNWSPSFLNYTTTISELLTLNIKNEEATIEQYRKTANLIPDENIVAIINRIILDEEYHIKLFKSLYDEYVCE
ncbi:ferritin-like domain-containing protein [Clostridium sp.]|uniref:ferritin-like domain-containing protein n=1 Tax=Clostridium sp. TaxID=1506 RepID=UPI003F33D120